MTIEEYYELYHVNTEQIVVDMVNRLYENAAHNRNGFCVMGRRGDLDNVIGVRNDNTRFMENAGVANFFYTDEEQVGNILSTQNWTVAMNDAWVLGGISSRSTFNMVYSGNDNGITEDSFNEFFNDTIIGGGRFPHTVTARELFALMLAGYEPFILHGVLVLVPGKESRTIGFREYVDQLNARRIDSADEDDRTNFENLLRNYLYNGFANARSIN